MNINSLVRFLGIFGANINKVFAAFFAAILLISGSLQTEGFLDSSISAVGIDADDLAVNYSRWVEFFSGRMPVQDFVLSLVVPFRPDAAPEESISPDSKSPAATQPGGGGDTKTQGSQSETDSYRTKLLGLSIIDSLLWVVGSLALSGLYAYLKGRKPAKKKEMIDPLPDADGLLEKYHDEVRSFATDIKGLLKGKAEPVVEAGNQDATKLTAASVGGGLALAAGLIFAGPLVGLAGLAWLMFGQGQTKPAGSDSNSGDPKAAGLDDTAIRRFNEIRYKIDGSIVYINTWTKFTQRNEFYNLVLILTCLVLLGFANYLVPALLKLFSYTYLDFSSGAVWVIVPAIVLIAGALVWCFTVLFNKFYQGIADNREFIALKAEAQEVHDAEKRETGVEPQGRPESKKSHFKELKVMSSGQLLGWGAGAFAALFVSGVYILVSGFWLFASFGNSTQAGDIYVKSVAIACDDDLRTRWEFAEADFVNKPLVDCKIDKNIFGNGLDYSGGNWRPSWQAHMADSLLFVGLASQEGSFEEQSDLAYTRAAGLNRLNRAKPPLPVFYLNAGRHLPAPQPDQKPEAKVSDTKVTEIGGAAEVRNRHREERPLLAFASTSYGNDKENYEPRPIAPKDYLGKISNFFARGFYKIKPYSPSQSPSDYLMAYLTSPDFSAVRDRLDAYQTCVIYESPNPATNPVRQWSEVEAVMKANAITPDILGVKGKSCIVFWNNDTIQLVNSQDGTLIRKLEKPATRQVA